MLKLGRLYFRLAGLSFGAILGILLGFSQGIADLLWGHSQTAQIWLRLYGPINGSIYRLLPFIPFAILGGILLGWIGYWVGDSVSERTTRKKLAATPPLNPPAEQVWPPPPKQSEPK